MNNNTILPTMLAIYLLSASSADGQITRSFLEPVEQREVAATQPDVVASMSVREGSSVKKGDILAELDNNVLRQTLKIAELRANSNSHVNAAFANLQVRQRKLRKLSSMLENGHANHSEVENARADHESATAELQLAKEKMAEAKYEVEKIKAEIERRVVRSPIDGVVTEIHAFPGEFIASSERQLMTVVRLDRLKVRFYLLSDDAAALKFGQSVTLKVGKQKDEIAGKVDFISPVTDPDSGTCRVEIVIENSDQRFRSGTVCFWITNE